MEKRHRTTPILILWMSGIVGGLVGLVAVLGVGFGVYLGLHENDFSKIGHSSQQNPILSLNADSAVKGKTISMATGAVSEGVEGLYVLDHASGNLQCWILNPRTGAVGGIFQTNILQDLPTDKPGAGDYVMVTGAFIFRAPVANNMSPSASICYVADESTGNVVGYSFNFNRQALTRGTMQSGVMAAVCAGPTRMEGTIRDQ